MSENSPANATAAGILHLITFEKLSVESFLIMRSYILFFSNLVSLFLFFFSFKWIQA